MGFVTLVVFIGLEMEFAKNWEPMFVITTKFEYCCWEEWIVWWNLVEILFKGKDYTIVHFHHLKKKMIQNHLIFHFDLNHQITFRTIFITIVIMIMIIIVMSFNFGFQIRVYFITFNCHFVKFQVTQGKNTDRFRDGIENFIWVLFYLKLAKKDLFILLQKWFQGCPLLRNLRSNCF